jgi:hypothetical protein
LLCATLIAGIVVPGGAASAVAALEDPKAVKKTAVTAVRSTAIVGTAWESDNTPIPQARLRLRSVVTGRIQATTMANELGEFTFHSVEPGSYVIELVNDAGRVLTVGHKFAVGPGETVATFVRLGTKVPWFTGFFGNAAAAVAATAAATGVTALAPGEVRPVSARR